MIWKMKKWNALWKKEKAEAKKEKILNSYDTEQVVCKICANKISKKDIKDHSGLCKEREEKKIYWKKLISQINALLEEVMNIKRNCSIQITILK